MSDRTVHARLSDGSEVVRYDRAGKWYREWPERWRWPAKRLSIQQAVETAKEAGAHVNFGLPGGSRFDKLVRETR